MPTEAGTKRHSLDVYRGRNHYSIESALDTAIQGQSHTQRADYPELWADTNPH